MVVAVVSQWGRCGNDEPPSRTDRHNTWPTGHPVPLPFWQIRSPTGPFARQLVRQPSIGGSTGCMW